MADPQNIKVGWNAPLEVDWDFALHLLRREISSAAPGKSGTLKADLLRESSVTINDEKTVITIQNPPPNRSWKYALIQDQGGPARDVIIRPKRAQALSFMWNGTRRFFKQVTMHAGQIKGLNYVYRGVMAWFEKVREHEWVKWKDAGAPSGGTRVSWGSHHYSAGIQRNRGIFG